MCDRCGGDAAGPGNFLAALADESNECQLMGLVHARLCNRCRTGWAGLIRTHPLWDRVLELDALEKWYKALALAGRPATQREYLEWERERNQLLLRVRDVALEFVRPIKAEG